MQKLIKSDILRYNVTCYQFIIDDVPSCVDVTGLQVDRFNESPDRRYQKICFDKNIKQNNSPKITEFVKLWLLICIFVSQLILFLL
jgi:hypothetical protein